MLEERCPARSRRVHTNTIAPARVVAPHALSLNERIQPIPRLAPRWSRHGSSLCAPAAHTPTDECGRRGEEGAARPLSLSLSLSHIATFPPRGCEANAFTEPGMLVCVLHKADIRSEQEEALYVRVVQRIKEATAHTHTWHTSAEALEE